MTVSGQLFGPGTPTTGTTISFHADAFGLSFQGEHAGLSAVRWTEITWRRGGFNDSQILVEWNREGDAFSLALGHNVAQQAVLNYLQSARQQSARKSKGTRGWIIGLVVVFVGLPVLVIALLLAETDRVIGLRGLVHAAGWRIALTIFLGDAGGSVAASLAENLRNLRFSRAQETDADLRGVKTLIDAGIDPRGMMEFFKKLAREGTSVPAILSSHPASEDRFKWWRRRFPKTGHSLPYPTISKA